MTPEELSELTDKAHALQAKYSRRRAVWARYIGRPLASDLDLTPEPGVLDADPTEEG